MSDPSTPPPQFRQPAEAPSAGQVADRDLWDKAAEGSLASVQAAAEKWRTGLAAFVTLITGGMLIKGPEASSDLTRTSLTVLTLCGALGLGLAVCGLWNALAAAAGTPSSLRYEDVVARHGSFRQYQVAAAAEASSKLAAARKLVAWSLVFVGCTVLAWWWAPSAPTHLVKVTYGDESVCGKLQSADDHKVVVKPSGASKMKTLSFDDVDNIAVVDEC